MGYALYHDNASPRRLGGALGAAVALHLAIVIGISFDRHDSPKNTSQQIAITLASSMESPSEDARYLSSQNQGGNGELADEDKVTQIDHNRGSTPVPTPVASASHTEQSSARMLTTIAQSETREVSQLERTKEQLAALQGISPELDSLSQNLLGLQADLDKENAAYARRPKVSRVTSVAAKGSLEADYLLRWRQKVEAVGNKYYPQASVRYNIYGSLRMLVTLRSDGSIQSTEILSSSGYGVLDEAAAKIVRMAAPYSPFPRELAAKADTMEIIRTWQFLDNRLSSTE